jgi:replication factor C subunit 3/5
MFLIDKYTPNTFEDAYFHKNLLKLLKTMSKDESIPHIIFYGHDGAGKKTIINLFLQMLFDSSVLDLKNVPYEIAGSGEKITTEIIKQSNYHIVIEPKKNNSDRFLIHNVVKDYARRHSLGIFSCNRSFKIIQINNLDNLSYYAQTSLRRTIENYSGECRFIMWCTSLSKVISPLLSRCVCFPIPLPSNEELLSYLFEVSISEHINVPLSKYYDILQYAKGNIKKALWYLEFLKYNCEIKTDYINTIEQIVSLIIKCKRPETVITIRNLFFKLTITNYLAENILQDVLFLLLASYHRSDKSYDDIRLKIIQLASETDYKLVKGRREIIQLDYFIISLLSIIHQYRSKILT